MTHTIGSPVAMTPIALHSSTVEGARFGGGVLGKCSVLRGFDWHVGLQRMFRNFQTDRSGWYSNSLCNTTALDKKIIMSAKFYG
jgi:hypothetical protein